MIYRKIFLAFSLCWLYSLSIWGQVAVPNGTVTSTTNPATNNMGINENTPKANLEIFRPKHAWGISNPALKIRTSGYYLPPGEYLLDDPANCPPQSNIIEVETEYNELACVIPQPAIPIPTPTKRLLTLTNEGYLGLNILNPRTMFHLNEVGNKNDIISLSYSAGNENWNYLNIGDAYLSFNSRQKNSVWEVDDGSYRANSFKISHGWGGLDFDFYNHPNNQQGAPIQTWTPFVGGWKNAMRIHWNGNIRMGEKTVLTGIHTDYKLSVDGKILAKEVVITNGPEWGDYVFEPGYDLVALDSLENFIVENKHLPNIPSASEIESNGIDVSEIISKQMVKIEELTLYIISQEKEIDALKKTMNELLEKLTDTDTKK